MREIVPGIHTWAWFSEEKGLDFNGFYVRGPHGSVIVDPPPYGDDDIVQMQKLGTPQAILISNGNHLRKSRDLAAHFDIPIQIHSADAAMLDPAPAVTFSDGDLLAAGLTAINIPHGKTPGETAFYAPWAKTLIIGDALIGKPPGSLNLLPASKFKDPAKAPEGIRRLLEVPIETILVGDGVPILQDGKKALRDFLTRSAAI